MNITKTNKTQPDLTNLSKSILAISTNYQIEKLYHILIKNPSLVNTKDQKNETFLSYAIKRKNVKTAELILTSPILDISYQDDNGNSYLHLAVINQLENIVRLLIKKGADINMKNNDGNTPLHFAYSTGDIKFIAILIENNGDLTIKNNEGIMPEDIEIDSFNEIIDSNYINMSNNSNITNKDNDNEHDNNENVENNEEYNDNGNENVNDNKIKNKKNESIKMNWENNKIKNDTIDNSNKQLKYSLVNYINSEENNEEKSNNDNDDNDDNNDNNDNDDNNDNNDNEEHEEESDNENEIKSKKLTYLNNGKDNLQNSDIFDLTSSIAYQEKIDNISYINSQIVGTPNNLSKNENNENGKDEKEEEGEDVVNIKKLKTNENKPIHNSLKENSDKQKIYQTKSFKTFFENGGNSNKFKIKEYNYKNCVTEKSMKDHKQIYKKDFNTTINKEKKSIKNNENKKINNVSDFNQDFDFSPIDTMKEPLNKKKNIDEKNNNANIKSKLNNNNYIYSNINKNLVLGNKPFFKKSQNNNGKYNTNIHDNNKLTKREDIDIRDMNKIHINDNDDSLIQPHPNFLNSKSIIDSSDNTAENTRKSKNINKNEIKRPQDPLYIFLSEINMEKYYNLMNSNGFEDIQLLIDETKSGIGVTDTQLKEGGIKIPGDRAKILIRLQEKAGNFVFQVPKNVYYICNDLDNYENDFHINKLKEWLKGLKIENYLVKFVEGGYHSIELMLLQMESKNPINDAILRDDLGIVKIGHRARIINKLLEEGKILNNKLKTSVLILGKKENEKICDCIIC